MWLCLSHDTVTIRIATTREAVWGPETRCHTHAISHRGYSTEIGRMVVRLIDIQEHKRDSGVDLSGRVTRVVSNTERHLLGLGCERLRRPVYRVFSPRSPSTSESPDLGPDVRKFGESIVGTPAWTRGFPGRVQPCSDS